MSEHSGTIPDETTVAFAFDIDGVLVKGKKPIPGATEAIKELQDKNIPFVFLTNGGGLTEKAHVEKVGMRLGLELDAKQFMQSHTPYFDLVQQYENKTILALGGHGQHIRELAHAYGFKKVVTSSDVMKECEHVHPFPEMTTAHHAEHGLSTSDRGHDQDLSATQISAILVWSSPRDWCLDLQIVGDLLLSVGGRLGTRSPKNGDRSLPNNGYLQDDQPKLYFCNPDFEWATQHQHPRFAQGAFREALKGIWKYATQGQAELQYEVMGKPMEKSFAYAERLLIEYNEQLNDRLGLREEEGGRRRIDVVYMIGDNPESDIIGANSFASRQGLEWRSVLVETGIYVAGTTPRHPPYYTAHNVTDAVRWVLNHERPTHSAEASSTYHPDDDSSEVGSEETEAYGGNCCVSEDDVSVFSVVGSGIESLEGSFHE